MQPTIRDYRPGDFAGLFALDQRCFQPGIAYSQDELAYFVRAKDSFTLIAEVSLIPGFTPIPGFTDAENTLTETPALLGFLIAQHYRARPAYQARIITIDVAPEARRHAIGARLMQAAEDRLRAAHVTTLRLEVSVENHAAQRFYRKLGFQETGRIERYYLDSIAALAMQKSL